MRHSVPTVALCLSLGCIVAASNSHAGPPPYDASLDTVTCNTLKGTMKLKPPYIFGGSAPAQVQIKGVLDGCTTSAPVAILPSKIKGTLALPSNDCLGFFGTMPAPGALTVKWKTGTPLASNSSTINVGVLSGGVFVSPWGSAHARFDLGISSVTGSFTGGDGGATSTGVVVTSEDLGAIGNGCAPSSGLKALTAGLGQIVLQ